jgi:apolipoprotein N-acyltransferase
VSERHLDRARWIVPVAGGLALPLAFAPFHLFFIAPLSYAALFWAWRDARPKQAFWRGFLFGCASFAAGTYWTYIAVHDFGALPVPLAVLISFALVATLALFVAVTGLIAARWLPTNGAGAWLVALPALFVLTEWVRGWLFTGFGWLSAGYSQTDSWLMGWAPLFGVHAMSWTVLVTGGALLVLWRGAARARLAAAVTVAALATAGLASGNRDWTAPKDRVLDVAIVQGAVAQELKWDPEQFTTTLRLYEDLTAQSADSDLIVWPEAAIPYYYERLTDYLDSLREWATERGSVILVGILGEGPDGGIVTFRNVLLSLTDPPTVYEKRHLVPFGEYYPVPGFVRNWLKLMSLPAGDAVSGAADQPPLDAAGEKIAVTICYEDVFGAEQLHSLPEATLLVNVSNDAWFGDSIAPHQHLQIARVRAAEAGRYLLRSTNTGISAVIGPRGGLVATIPQFQPGVLKAPVQGYTGATPYALWGNYPVVIGALVALAAVLGATRRRS